jgi:hypothetical protein
MNTQNASRDGSRATLFADVDEVNPPFASQTCHASPALEKGDGWSCTRMYGICSSQELTSTGDDIPIPGAMLPYRRKFDKFRFDRRPWEEHPDGKQCEECRKGNQTCLFCADVIPGQRRATPCMRCWKWKRRCHFITKGAQASRLPIDPTAFIHYNPKAS